MTRRSFFLLPALAVLVAASPLFAQPYLGMKTAAIANNASLSGAVDLQDNPLVAVLIPSAWTTADITFQASVDGTNYYNVYNMSGDEYTITVGGTSRLIVLSPLEFQWARYVKIRSGTAGTPVAQGGARTLTVVVRRIQ